MHERAWRNEIERTPASHSPILNAETVKDLLESVDFEVINSIFDSLVEKSGGSQQVQNTAHKVSLDKISVIPLREDSHSRVFTVGEANVYTGHIELMEETRDVSPQTIKLRFLKNLIHESTHVRGSYVERTEVNSENELTKATVRTGLFQIEHSTEQGKHEIGLSLNEAVTETIAHEVFVEYLRRTGDSALLQDEITLKELGWGSYMHDRIALGVLVDLVAKEAEVHRDTVWKGFVHAYMSGNDELTPLLLSIASVFRENHDALQILGPLYADKRIDLDADIKLLVTPLSTSDERIAVLERVMQPYLVALQNVLQLR